MKKSALLFGILAVMPGFAHAGQRYNTSCMDCGYETARPTKTQSYRTSKGKQTGYRNIITNNFYYTQPGGYYARPNNYNNYPENKITRSRVEYKNDYDYDDVDYKEYETVEKVTQSYSTKMRKYFLAHPFFQPAKGRFGSVTDISYSENSFKFDMLNASALDIDPVSDSYGQIIVAWPIDLDGRQETTQFAVKEDFSYGITNSLSIIGMAQYDKTKVSFKDWSSGDADSSSSNSGINVFGIGLQHRFVDSDEWIAMISGHFQHQKDTANTLIGEIKGGYKVNRTTLYGLGRIGYSDLTDGDVYGAFVKDSDGDWLVLSYKTDASSVLYAEMGAGAFSVLNKYLTLNGELIYGSYDWHSQLSIKGSIGVQPNDNFSLNLYAAAALYDSAKGKTLKYMNYDINPDVSEFPAISQNTKLIYTTGNYKIKDYNEWKIGLQAIFYF